MDFRNPWIALRKAWIHALYDDPLIACSIHGLHSVKGAKLGFAQNMDWPKLYLTLHRYEAAIHVEKVM